MPPDISDGEAELALSSIEHRRRQVIAEIDMPPWYWWGLAAGWIGLGILADFDHPWLTLVVTLCFGAAHAWVASHVLSGRHRSRQLSVRADVVDPHIPAFVIGFLLLMVGTPWCLRWWPTPMARGIPRSWRVLSSPSSFSCAGQR
jgi:drug/metabolite transporter (DMT)-like permease